MFWILLILKKYSCHKVTLVILCPAVEVFGAFFIFIYFIYFVASSSWKHWYFFLIFLIFFFKVVSQWCVSDHGCCVGGSVWRRHPAAARSHRAGELSHKRTVWMDGAGGGGAHRRAEVGHLPSDQRGQKGETNKQTNNKSRPWKKLKLFVRMILILNSLYIQF